MKFPSGLLRQCWFLAGPTAVGKSALAIELAREIGGEILSMDSMAIYRGMDIGTAKPSPEEMAQVPHHLINLVDPEQEFSTAEYLTHAIQCSEDVLSRGRIPIFAGGTGLYLRSLLRGVFEGPPADWAFRQQLIDQVQNRPVNWLHSQLFTVDPVTAGRLHPNDTRRLIRALEIYTLTGQAPSVLHQEHPLPPEERPLHNYWLHPPRDWLYNRINQRVRAMFDQGLESEVRRLISRPQELGRTASQALGYREVIDWIQGRLPSRSAAEELIQTRTRQFAKRQHTWFRNLKECCEIPLTGMESVTELRERLLCRQ